MTRLIAEADPASWASITGSGFRAGRHRRAAARMLVGATGVAQGSPASGLLGFIAGQAARALLRSADGRVLAWVHRDDPGLVTVIAQVQELTDQLRTARAMMPMSYDDTETFGSPLLGAGEKLLVDMPQPGQRLVSATYTWDTGTHLLTVQALSTDRERFGTVIPDVERLVRTIHLSDDLTSGESNVLRLPPA